MIELAEVPFGYKFAAKNSYTKGRMFWHITIIGSTDPDFSAWRVLDGMNQFPIEHGQMVAVKGESKETKDI